jgi:probable HAF family extracellular repeat protein
MKHPPFRILGIALLILLCFPGAIAQVNGSSETCSFTFFKVLQGSVPGIGGINDSDVVSGTVQQIQTMYGFIRKPNGVTNTFLVNGHPAQASKINNQGYVVGSAQAGFRRSPTGQILTLKDPNGANGTFAHGINNTGEIVGWYDTSAAVQKGFIYKNGAYTSFSHSGWFFLQAEGVNKFGVIVGSYLDSANKMHGFLYHGGMYATLNFPGASNTDALGINDAGQIVGWYLPSGSSYSQGFLYSNGQYSTVLVNGVPSISVNAINNLGHIYGDVTGKSFIGKNCH